MTETLISRITAHNNKNKDLLFTFLSDVLITSKARDIAIQSWGRRTGMPQTIILQSAAPVEEQQNKKTSKESATG